MNTSMMKYKSITRSTQNQPDKNATSLPNPIRYGTETATYPKSKICMLSQVALNIESGLTRL